MSIDNLLFRCCFSSWKMSWTLNKGRKNIVLYQKITKILRLPKPLPVTWRLLLNFICPHTSWNTLGQSRYYLNVICFFEETLFVGEMLFTLYKTKNAYFQTICTSLICNTEWNFYTQHFPKSINVLNMCLPGIQQEKAMTAARNSTTNV